MTRRLTLFGPKTNYSFDGIIGVVGFVSLTNCAGINYGNVAIVQIWQMIANKPQWKRLIGYVHII